MKTAFAVQGFLFLVILVGAYFAFNTYQSNEIKDMTLSLSSPAFEQGGTIPTKYTCDGENMSPPLTISGVPEGTQSLALLVEDPDVPKEIREDQMFDHWVLYGIDPSTTEIPEGQIAGSVGKNTRGNEQYTGPCPPVEYEPTEHRYFFKLYALSSTLNFIAAPSKSEVETAIQDMIIEEATLLGVYDRAKEN